MTPTVFSKRITDFCCMFEKLKKRWKVNTLNMILIFCTFAIGGSICGKAGRIILNELFDHKNVGYWLLYVILITLLWPLAVLITSIPLGQFAFFKNYLQKIWGRISGKQSQK